MITESERKKLRALFQGNYTEGVLELLAEGNITNKNKKPYTAQYVRMVFQGVRKNVPIETAIWKLASKKIEEQNQQELLRKQIIAKTT